MSVTYGLCATVLVLYIWTQNDNLTSCQISWNCNHSRVDGAHKSRKMNTKISSSPAEIFTTTQVSSLNEEMIVQLSSSPLHSFMSELIDDRPEISTVEFLIIDDNAKLRKIRDSKPRVVVDSQAPLHQRASNESRWDRASITLGECTTTITTTAPITRTTVQSSLSALPQNQAAFVPRKEGRRVRADTHMLQPKRRVSSDKVCQSRPSPSASKKASFDDTSQLKGDAGADDGMDDLPPLLNGDDDKEESAAEQVD